MLGAVGLFYWEQGPQQYVYKTATISKFLREDTSTWYRLIAGLFVHGKHNELQALVVFGALFYNGLRVERSLGAGGFLFCFLAGGAAGDAVRVWNEAPTILDSSAGTTAGALALIGASVSIQIRTREKNFVAAIFGGMIGALITTMFSGPVLFGAAFTRVLPPMLPAAGTSFLIGGFIAGLVPLYDPKRLRLVRGGLLLVSLGALGWGLASYGAALWPLVKPSPHARPAVADEPEVELHWDPRLEKYEFGVPITHRIEGKASDRSVILVGNRGGGPVVEIEAWPRNWMGKDTPDAQARDQVLRFSENFPDAKQLEDGPMPASPLGPAYRYVVSMIRQDQTALHMQVCLVQGPKDFIRVLVTSMPEDLHEAKALANAIVRSLKVHSPPADKKGGGSK